MKLTNGRRAVLPLLLAFFAGSAQALECKVTPEYTIVAEGQTVELSAQCDDSLLSADWKMGTQSVTGVITLTQPIPQSPWTCNVNAPTAAACPPPVKFTTPVALNANGSTYTFTVDVVANDGLQTHASATSSAGMVYVKPTNVLAAAAGQTGTTPIDAQCGTANGAAVQAMPSGAAQCQIGDPALAITSATSYSWTCVSPNNGADASCYASRGYTVTATAGPGGTITPPSRNVATGDVATFTATPSSGNAATIIGCNGTQSGNSFTTGPVTGPCTVTASFSSNVSGACGSQNGQLTTSTLTSGSANLCSAGSVASFAAGTGAYTWNCQGVGSGSTANCQATKAYIVTATAGANGSITPASRTVAHGSTATFTTTPLSGYVASASGCGGSLSGNSYTTGIVTSDCPVTASFAPPAPTPISDPGRNTGLWMPATLPDGSTNNGTLIVVDQMNANGAGSVTVAPGCINQRADTATCRNSGSASDKLPSGATFVTTLSQGKIVSIRYDTYANSGTTAQTLQIDSTLGGPFSFNLSASISKVPGDFSNPKCTATVPGGSLQIRTGEYTSWAGVVSNCPLTPNSRYYVNLRMNSVCTSSSCAVAISEPSDLH